MAQRTVCLCDGKYIGIETIFTVINGRQINIPERLKELRAKSQSNQLFCPCGCGANLVLVAGDRNLREQHFRLKDGTYENKCHVVIEGKTSVDSKIVLKCWLDEKLETDDIETRVPVNLVGSIERKYEFSFLSRFKKIAVSYCHGRENLSDEKFEILEANRNGIQMIYIVDAMNGGSNGQYPEALMRIQNRQGYCLLLYVEDAAYSDAMMSAAFYMPDNDGLWRELKIAEGYLCDYRIDGNGQVLYKDSLLAVLQEEQKMAFESSMYAERIWREQGRARYEEKKRLQEAAERNRLEACRRQGEAERERQEARRRQELHKRREEAEIEWKQRQKEERLRREKEEAERQAESKRRDEEFKINMASGFSQQQTQVRDAEGNRWIKCEICGLIAKESEFSVYGGANHVNLGTCKTCFAKKEVVVELSAGTPAETENTPKRNRYDPLVCPECGGKLREKSGLYGSFMGCSNYPKCRFTRRIRKKV